MNFAIKKSDLLRDRNKLKTQIMRIEEMLSDWYDWKNDDVDNSVAPPSVADNHSYSLEDEKTADDEIFDTIYYTEESNAWIEQASGVVTVKSFQTWLRNKYPQAKLKIYSLNNPIRKLCEKGKLEVISKGSGKRPSKYKVVNS